MFEIGIQVSSLDKYIKFTDQIKEKSYTYLFLFYWPALKTFADVIVNKYHQFALLKKHFDSIRNSV